MPKIKYIDPGELLIISNHKKSKGKPASFDELFFNGNSPLSVRQRRELVRVINSLPSIQRKVVRLVLKNYTEKDIANKLDIQVSSVYNIRQMAVKKIREKIRK